MADLGEERPRVPAAATVWARPEYQSPYAGADRVAGPANQREIEIHLIEQCIPPVGMLREQNKYTPKIQQLLGNAPIHDLKLLNLQNRIHATPSAVADALDHVSQVNRDGASNTFPCRIDALLWDFSSDQHRLDFVVNIVTLRKSFLMNPIMEFKVGLCIDSCDNAVFGRYSETFHCSQKDGHPAWLKTMATLWRNQMAITKTTLDRVDITDPNKKFPQPVPQLEHLESVVAGFMDYVWASPVKKQERNKESQQLSRDRKRARIEELEAQLKEERKEADERLKAQRQEFEEVLAAAKQEAMEIIDNHRQQAKERADRWRQERQDLESQHWRQMCALQERNADSFAKGMTQVVGNSIAYYATQPHYYAQPPQLSQQVHMTPTQQQQQPRQHHMPRNSQSEPPLMPPPAFHHPQS